MKALLKMPAGVEHPRHPGSGTRVRFSVGTIFGCAACGPVCPPASSDTASSSMLSRSGAAISLRALRCLPMPCVTRAWSQGADEIQACCHIRCHSSMMDMGPAGLPRESPSAYRQCRAVSAFFGRGHARSGTLIRELVPGTMFRTYHLLSALQTART